MQAPAVYETPLARAAAVDAGFAARYATATRQGDPPADAVILALRDVAPDRQQAWITAGMDGDAAALADAPAALIAFFAEAERRPDWWDPAGTAPGGRAFTGQAELFLAGFVGGTLIEGFASMIARSFALTGRIVDQGVRRLRQNNRHLVEIFLPGGLEREGEGWKLSVRIRLQHARVRDLIRLSGEWDEAACGTPLSAAHVALATAAFSGTLLKHATALGARLNAAETESFMMIWRYSGHLMGVPPDLQCATYEQARRFHELAMLCEPEPDIDNIILANALINSAPLLLGQDEPARRRALSRHIYRVSRCLIGDGLADRLNFPPGRGLLTLQFLQWRMALDRAARHAFPAFDRRRRLSQFTRLMELSFYDCGQIDYRMAGHLHAEKDRPAA